MTVRWRWAVVFVLGGSIAWAGQAAAGDYSHICRTADGRYEINDGDLGETANPTGPAIPYENIAETVLSERRGHCVARGNVYKFEARTYVLKIRFRAQGATVVVDALCELAADGLPAEYKCEREVVTYERKGTPPAAAPAMASGAKVWDHNGSAMRLDADGATRRFVYVTPRPGMAAVGAKPGDVVFEGRRDRDTYAGTAYFYSRACGRVPYAVQGQVDPSERRVRLEGRAPKLDKQCRPVDTVRDVLVFDLVP